MIAPATPDAAIRIEAEDGTDRRDHIRSPVDVLRLVVGVVTAAVGIVVANLFDSSLLALSEDGSGLLSDLPSWVQRIPASVLAIAVLAAVVGALAWAQEGRSRRRPDPSSLRPRREES